MNEKFYKYIFVPLIHILAAMALLQCVSTAAAADMCSNLQLIGTFHTPGNAMDVAVSGGNAFIADSSGGLQVISVAAPSAPVHVGDVSTSDAVSLFIQGDHAYIADSASGMRIIDISTPSSPWLVSTVNTPDTANDVYVSGTSAYIADGASDNASGGLGGLQIIDVSDPLSPSINGAVDLTGYARGVHVDGNYVYLSETGTGTGLEVVRITDLSIVGSANTTGTGNDVHVSGGFAYISDGIEGLLVMGGIPVFPSIIGSYKPGGSANRAVLNGDYIYLVNGSGLQVIDISSRDNPVPVASFLTTGSAQGIAVSADYAYVADGNQGLRIIDISGVPPDIEISSGIENFGEVDTGKRSAPVEITVTNRGCASLVLGTLSLEGADRKEFSITSDSCSGATIKSYANCTVKMEFIPLTVGTKNASLILPSNDDTATPSIINLSGTATSPDIISSPSSDQDFGTVAINTTSSPIYFTISNQGTSGLNISTAAINGGDASHFMAINDLCSGRTVGAGESCTLDVTFTPLSVGRKEVNLIISSNDPDTPSYSVTLVGTGQSPLISVTPDKYDFGGVRVGETDTGIFTITNQGNISLVINALSITGRAASRFSLLNDNCSGSTLPHSGTCTFSIRFAPTSTGAKAATAHITSNDADSSDTAVDLSGTGTLSSVKLTPPSVNFKNVLISTSSQVIRVSATNTGTAPLNLGSLSLTGDGAASFSMRDDHISGTQLPPAGQASVDLVFSPGSIGVYTAMLNVPSDDPNAPVATLPIRGTGASPVISVSPAVWDYGRVFVNRDSSKKEFTVKNTGVVDLHAGIITIFPTGDFKIKDDQVSGSIIEAGKNATFTVEFAPTARGTRNVTVNIPSNDVATPVAAISITGTGEQSDVQVSPRSYNFGYIAVGNKSKSKLFTITNTGGKALSITSVSLPKGADDIFKLEKDNCSDSRIDSGKTCTFNAVFQPTVSGLSEIQITVLSDAPASPSLNIPLRGIGDVPVIKVSTGKYDFGNIPLHRSSTPFRIKVSAASGVSLKIDKAVLGGNTAKQFTVKEDTCSSTILAPSETCHVDVAFTPSEAGIMEAVLAVSSNAPASPVLEISLLGSTVEKSADCSGVVSLGSITTTGEVFDVAVSDHYALLPDNLEGLRIVDFQDAANMTTVATLSLPGEATAIDVQGAYAYVVTLDRGLHIIDISHPGSPVLTGSVNTSGYARDVSVRGGYAYVADGLAGLHVIDISDPAAPVIMSTVDTPGFALNVALQGDYAYVADADSGLQVISLAKPYSPAITGCVDTPGDALHVAVSNSSALVADGSKGLQVIDITDPYAPVLQYGVPVKKSAMAVYAHGGFAYVADGSAGLQVVDVTDPNHLLPEIAANIKTSGSAFGITLADDLGFVASGSAGVEIIDLKPCAMSSRQFHLSMAPASYDFGNVIIAQDSRPRRFTVMNTGDSLASFDVFVDGPDKGKFSVRDNTCAHGLPPLARCDMEVVFSPVVTGLESATLNISDDVSGTPSLVIQLQGRGIPLIDFNPSPVSGSAPLKVTFTDRSSKSIESWVWDFGDGSTGTEQNPIHTFSKDGIYTVLLTASDAGGTYQAHHAVMVESGTLNRSFFPAVLNSSDIDTRLCIINTDSNSTLTGLVRFYGENGEIPSTAMTLRLSPSGRTLFSVKELLPDAVNITHAALDTDSANITGYVEYCIAGYSDAAVPLIKNVSSPVLHIPLILSNASWWTGIALLNTGAAVRNAAIEFNNGDTRTVSLAPGAQKFMLMRDFFQGIPRPDITSAVISGAADIAAMEFMSGGTMAAGLALSGTRLTSAWTYFLYNNLLQTGFVLGNPSMVSASVTATPYDMAGIQLPVTDVSVDPYNSYLGVPQSMGLPGDSIWVNLNSNQGLTGLNFIFTTDGSLLAMYSMADTPAKNGLFPDISKGSWSVFAFLNTSGAQTSVILTAFDDQGNILDSVTVNLAAHAHMTGIPQSFFSRDISDATYCSFNADHEIAAMQFRGSPDGTGMFALPVLR